MSDDTYTLEEWIMLNEVDGLRDDVEANISLCTDLDQESFEDLYRLIMISIRQFRQLRGIDDEE